MSNYLLVDASVTIYQSYYRNEKHFNPHVIRPEQAVRYMAEEIKKLILPAVDKGYEIILIFDKKNERNCYWRQDFIVANQVEHDKLWDLQGNVADQKYKGGRKSNFTVLLDYVKLAAEELKKEYKFFIFPGLEADDIIALFCKYKTRETKIDFLTVDRDWCGLVNDVENIRWINLLPAKRYQIETEKEVVDYFKKKLDPNITKPSECYELKRVYGEIGDQLPKNCRAELIDLINHAAPLEFGFANAHDEVKAFLS